ncbi:hypothetical protein P280DRAFT_524421 [Massarina eburnea CBS 473.64]|uniref:UDENN FLCN/SMCR8-type domain-containing protein n=1 Tax=Massarina eburnea CBS 473.64 TaxID=1395130 RepID=A0A6A6RGD6_9PLEO|nr:hypothetical protein P280DRAFT_524421 [Massarina eburnea CBS 473.64]
MDFTVRCARLTPTAAREHSARQAFAPPPATLCPDVSACPRVRVPISLAHFCEIHGPTSIICTQASASACASCNPCVTPPSEDPHAPFSYNGLYDQPTSLKLNSGRLPQLTSPFETPPTSPRSPSHNPYFPSFPKSDSSFGSRRPSSAFDSEPDVCENCQIVIPKKTSDRLPDGAPGSPCKDGRGRNGSPVLRTSHNYPVRGSAACGSMSSSESDTSDTEQSKSFESSGSHSNPASPMFVSRSSMHTHTLSYVSTSQPHSPTSYSLLRRTCIRTLSTETLPMGKASGPMFFGDSHAGYTIAYVFRLQDPRSRGAKRTYALIAMAGRDGLRATRAMVKVTEVFESIANWIISLAEKVLEKESAASLLPVRPATAIPSTPPPGESASMPAFATHHKERSMSSVGSNPRTITPVSSFLSAKRLDPDGHPRSRDMTKAKSLIELVGMENFFVELHQIFCRLLHSLINQFGQFS